MKIKIFIFLFFIGCSMNYDLSVIPLNSKGFAYIYNEQDYEKKIISKNFDNYETSIGHLNLKAGSLVKIINPENKKFLILKVKKRVAYPAFFNILITKPVAEYLKLDPEIPYVEFYQIKKNKSFVADRAETTSEEKSVYSKAPVTSVKIDNISTIKTLKVKEVKTFSIILGTFYSLSSAETLKKNLSRELYNFNKNKLLIKKEGKNKFTLLAGSYKAINLLKNDYIVLKEYGLEQIEIQINE